MINCGKRKYKIITEHKIFGRAVIKGVISKVINNDDKIGVVVHGKEIYCRKHDKTFKVVEKNGVFSMSDELMKIIVK